MSSVELSRDIAQVISRARGGEPIDTAGEGEELAARYPELKMSGELIGKAIVRAAGMLGLEMNGTAAPAAQNGTTKAANGHSVEPFFLKRRRRNGASPKGIPRRGKRRRFFPA